MMFRAALLTVLLTFGLITSFEASARALVLGSVSDNIKKHFARFEPLAEYLSEKLAGAGVTDVQFTVLSSADAMAEALHEGRIDLYFDSPLVAARVARHSNSAPFLRRWKRDVASYHSVIIVSADSDIQTLSDLEGRRIGFQKPDSTSGFMLPAGMLRHEGLTLRELPSRSAQPRDNEVGYVFTRDDKNTLVWLYKGWVDAAATDPQSYQDLIRAKPGSVRVIARSIEVPRQVVVHRHGMEQPLIDSLTRVLSAMDQSERGREVLKRFNKTTRFDHFPKGVDATFNPIYELLDELEAQGVL